MAATPSVASLLTTPEPDDFQRDRWGRPLITPPDGGAPVPYTRASSIGKAIEDTYHLSRWQQRQVLLGAQLAPLLLLEVESLGPEPDRADEATWKAWKGAIDALVDRAHEAADSHDRASLGTTMHSVFEAVDLGRPVPPIPDGCARDVEARAEATRGWRWLCRERRVVNDRFRSAGTLDGLLLVPLEQAHLALRAAIDATKDDSARSALLDVYARYEAWLQRGVRWLIRTADDKTGRSLDFAGLGYCAQVATYADALLYDVATGTRAPFTSLLPADVDPATVELDTDTAVIVHTPAGAGRCSIVEVPLAQGRAAAEQACRVREMRTAAKKWLRTVETVDLSAEANAPTTTAAPPAASTPPDPIVDLIASATTYAELTDIYAAHGPAGDGTWTPEHTEVAKARRALIESGLAA